MKNTRTVFTAIIEATMKRMLDPNGDNVGYYGGGSPVMR